MKSFLVRRNVRCVLLILAANAISCAASAPNIQPQVNGLVVANRLTQALKVLNSQPQAYGPNNQLLYLMDRGLVLHLSKQYTESINTFEQVKHKLDELYTKSLSTIGQTWLVNDYAAPYRGEDFEHVLVNVFQALNFAAVGNFQEALVEARAVNSKLLLINSQYSPKERNVYREDAFVRFLMGILYEASGAAEDLNDAFISLRKAEAVYEQDYGPQYHLPVPQILKENILALARWMGSQEWSEYHRKYPGVSFMTLEEKGMMGEVILVQYNGLAPIKVQTSIPLPLPGGYITKLAFPRYKIRTYEIFTSQLTARNAHNELMNAKTELSEDIKAIAIKNLDDRKVRTIAKAVLRPAGKYILEKNQEENVRRRLGDDATSVYKGVSSLYNLNSEQADLRSWQTLPAEIRVARLLLKPGIYEVTVDNFDSGGNIIETLNLGAISVVSGEKRFLMIRTAK